MSRKHHRKSHDEQADATGNTPAPATSTSRRKILYGLVVLSVASIALGIYSSRSSLREGGPARAANASSRSTAGTALASIKPFHDFGTISMALGKVKHVYTVSNVAQAPVTIEGVGTSCMCTIATVVTSRGRAGPFGMPGHGSVPTIRERLAPGDSATVEIVFDPAAHGPAGVGRIDRTVTLETSAGEVLQLAFVAMVKP